MTALGRFATLSPFSFDLLDKFCVVKVAGLNANR